MPETTIIEETVEVLPTQHMIVVEGVAAYAVLSLAAYGAQDIARKGVAKAKQIRANRKAKKAAEKSQTQPQPQQ